MPFTRTLPSGVVGSGDELCHCLEQIENRLNSFFEEQDENYIWWRKITTYSIPLSGGIGVIAWIWEEIRYIWLKNSETPPQKVYRDNITLLLGFIGVTLFVGSLLGRRRPATLIQEEIKKNISEIQAELKKDLLDEETNQLEAAFNYLRGKNKNRPVWND